ncbi:MAG: hypothetical protein HY326_00315 [Chloroflexi bacterium]|nr:hypothetical protein [Chloroflexota bacterium]
MDIFKVVTSLRRRVMDLLIPVIMPISPNEVTRLGGWFFFIATLGLLAGLPGVCLGGLVTGLLLDGIDGSVARHKGITHPYIDVAMDRYTEFILFAAFAVRYPGGWDLLFLVALVANIFLPRGKIPVLPMRAVFLIVFYVKYYRL